MIYLAMCLLCIVAIELFFFLPVLDPVKSLLIVSQKSAKVVSSSRISDHWKEKVLQRYARDMAVASIKIGLGLLGVFAIVGAVAYLMDMLLTVEVSVLEYAVSAEGLILATLFSVFYIFVRKRLVSA